MEILEYKVRYIVEGRIAEYATEDPGELCEICERELVVGIYPVYQLPSPPINDD